jgi:hypothetical protein
VVRQDLKKGGRTVKITVLSDHAADQLRQREAERQARYDAQYDAYEQRLRVRQELIEAGRAERRAARQQGRYMRAAAAALCVAWHRYRKLAESRKRPVKESPGTEDHIWREGQAGEDALAAYLGRSLAGDWVMVKGYRNPKGEIDAILIGPGGIFSMEAKHYRGIISCEGDCWTRDKYDSWGNKVLCGEPIADHGGRGPSRQINESTDFPERFMRKTVPLIRICRTVMFTRDDAAFGQLRNVTVDGVYLLSDFDLGDMLRKSAVALTGPEVERAEELIRKDHQYWERRLSCAPASRPSRSDRNAA